MTENARLRSFIDRILTLKKEQDDLAEIIRSVYAEAKGDGYDKTALGKVVAHVRKREKDAAALSEAETLFDLYLAEYDSRPSHAHTHAREAA